MDKRVNLPPPRGPFSAHPPQRIKNGLPGLKPPHAFTRGSARSAIQSPPYAEPWTQLAVHAEADAHQEEILDGSDFRLRRPFLLRRGPGIRLRLGLLDFPFRRYGIDRARPPLHRGRRLGGRSPRRHRPGSILARPPEERTPAFLPENGQRPLRRNPFRAETDGWIAKSACAARTAALALIRARRRRRSPAEVQPTLFQGCARSSIQISPYFMAGAASGA